LNFNKIIETENTFYGINDSEGGRVVAQRIATRNLFGISLNHEPLYIGVLWKKNQEGQLVVLDEKNTSALKTTKIIKIFEEKG
jgi:hypothetical protein